MILILLLIATCLQQNVVQKINCHFLYTIIGPNYLVLFEVKKFLLHCTLTSSNNVLFLLSSKHPWHGKAQSSVGLQIVFSILVSKGYFSLQKTKIPPPTLFWSPWVPQIDVWTCGFWEKFGCCFRKIPILYYKRP